MCTYQKLKFVENNLKQNLKLKIKNKNKIKNKKTKKLDHSAWNTASWIL
jgi:hypothetical protein